MILEYSNKGNWKRVLLEIYRFAPSLWGQSNKIDKYDDRHDLAKKLNIKGHELGNSIVFLEEQNLIKSTEPDSRANHSISWILTEKGFNVALELEKQEREIREKEKLFHLFLIFQ